jgi:hypothetical protein
VGLLEAAAVGGADVSLASEEIGSNIWLQRKIDMWQRYLLRAGITEEQREDATRYIEMLRHDQLMLMPKSGPAN